MRTQEMNYDAAKLRELEDAAISTGSLLPVIQALEMFRIERLAIFLEDVLLFAPDGSQAREVSQRLLVHFNEVRRIVDLLQEVE